MSEEPAEAPQSRLRNPLLVLLGLVLFAGAAVLFVRLLEPLARADTATPRPPMAAAVSPPPVPAPVAPPVAGTAAAIAPVRAPFRPDFTGPRIAIVLTDVGVNPADARTAITKLPAEIGLAFSPYPDESRALADTARKAGHEVWVGVPMQPKSWPRVSPGANTLTVDATPAENTQRLGWVLARVGPATGVTSIMGSQFLERAAALDPVLTDLKSRNLAFLDSRVSGRSVGMARARAAGVPAILNDRFLDEGGGIAANLAELATAARLNGSAVGFARPSAASVAAISAWAATLEGKGVLLVPPGSLAK